MQDLLNMLPKVSGRAGGGSFKVEGTNKPEKEFAKRMRAPKRPNPKFNVFGVHQRLSVQSGGGELVVVGCVSVVVMCCAVE